MTLGQNLFRVCQLLEDEKNPLKAVIPYRGADLYTH